MWNNLEHEFLKQIKDLSAEPLAKDCFFIFAVSGGEDSMVLLNLGLHVLKNKNFAVAHAHHGLCEPSSTIQVKDELVKYRNEAKNFIENFCKDHDIAYYHRVSSEVLTSENEMREFRYRFLFDCREKIQVESPGKRVCVVTAHHSLDQLETRLMSLIRGCGFEGLQAMQVFENYIFRPLLQVSKEEIRIYAKEKKIQFFEDPSNLQSDYFRNWLRNEWLTKLEDKKSGSLKRLQESLQTIAEDSLTLGATVDHAKISKDYANGLSREQYDFSLKSEQRYQLYHYIRFVLRQSNLKPSNDSADCQELAVQKGSNFKTNNSFISRGQIEEIQKYLDKSQKELTFRAVGLKWIVNAKQIIAIKE